MENRSWQRWTLTSSITRRAATRNRPLTRVNDAPAHSNPRPPPPSTQRRPPGADGQREVKGFRVHSVEEDGGWPGHQKKCCEYPGASATVELCQSVDHHGGKERAHLADQHASDDQPTVGRCRESERAGQPAHCQGEPGEERLSPALAYTEGGRTK